MPLPTRDPLLTAGKLVVALSIAILAFAAVMVAIALGAVLTVERDETIATLVESGADAGVYPVVVAGLAVLICVLWLAGWFMKVLYRLIRSVEEGDPFNPENAARLARMGWLTLGIQGGLFLVATLAAKIGTLKTALLAEDAFDLSVGAIILTLVLFILARVFRLGAAMRDDLEGTI